MTAESAWPPPRGLPDAPGSASGGGPGPPTTGAPATRRAIPKAWIWGFLGLALVVALVSAHKITELEVIFFCVLLPSLILHEIAHGAAAYACGDDTAKRAGRLSLNPARHVDPIGTFLVPAITVLSGWGFFGWAKPVPVNVSKLRSPRNQGVLVALAGPATNVVLAGLSAVVFHLCGAANHLGPTTSSTPIWVLVLYSAGLVNVWVAVFNMIPVPPLDGSVLFERLLPASLWPGYLRLRQYALPVLFGGLILLSMAHVYPTAPLLNRLETWWQGVLGI